jgi:hypothetical protein
MRKTNPRASRSSKRATERRVSKALTEWVKTGGKATKFPAGRRDNDWISVRLRRNPAGRTQIALDKLTTLPLWRSIAHGDRVSIMNRFGQIHSGRAVMLGPAGWVLNMGGPHGTLGIATDSNVVAVKKRR